MSVRSFLWAAAWVVTVGTATNASAEGASPGREAPDPWATQVRGARTSADEVLDEMMASSRLLSRLLMEARARGDAGRARCTGDGLTRVNVAVRRARADVAEAFGAYTRHDAEAARHAMSRLVSDREASRIASRDVEECVSLERAIGDRTEVRVTIDPGIVSVDR